MPETTAPIERTITIDPSVEQGYWTAPVIVSGIERHPNARFARSAPIKALLVIGPKAGRLQGGVSPLGTIGAHAKPSPFFTSISLGDVLDLGEHLGRWRVVANGAHELHGEVVPDPERPYALESLN